MVDFPARRSAEQVMDAVRRHWDLSGPLPLPIGGWLACPVCRVSEPAAIPRHWKWHKRPGKPTIPFRCDVSFKCVECAHVFVFGVAVDHETWKRCARPVNKQIKFDEAKARFEAWSDGAS